MPHAVGKPLAPDEKIIRTPHIRWIAYLYAFAMFLVLMVTGQIGSLITTELVMTDRRVIGKRGLIIKKSIDVPYAEIIGVKVRQGLLGKLFDYGRLVIATKDGVRISFLGIAEPYDIQQQIQELSETAVLGYTLAQYTQEKF